ncbi:unnamed protein product [Closterium sp. NIES-54]
MIVYATFIRDNKLVSELMQLITVEKADASVKDKLNSNEEALAAKEAAEALPVFDMVDDLIRVTADLLGRSAPKHQRFMDLQQLFTETSLEAQGIHQVRWLSRGEAMLCILAVWPAVVIFQKDYHSAMYLLATSYRFHFFMYFLADVLEQLNLLNKSFQQRQLDLISLHAQIKRTTSHLESRYVDCGDDFGGGLSRRLSPFFERYGPRKKRDVTVEGVDFDGRPEKITFTLHDNPVDRYDGPEDHDGCIDICTDFAECIVANLERRLGDLDSLSGVRLFMPDEWPKGEPKRHARCVEWLLSLVTLFNAQDSEEILPGINKRKAQKELRLFYSVLAAAPQGERTFDEGLTVILKTPDWRESCPNLVQLWVAVAVIPLSTVECERGLSRQNPMLDEVVDIWRSYKKRKPFSKSPISTPGEPSKKGKAGAMEVKHPEPVDALDLSSDSDDDDEDEEDDVDEDMAYRM